MAQPLRGDIGAVFLGTRALTRHYRFENYPFSQQRILPVKLRQISSFAVGLVLAGALASCQPPEASNNEGSAQVASEPDAKPGMALTRGELFLPIIPGRPGAVYFKVNNGSDKPVTLVSVHVQSAANAEIHETSAEGMNAREKVEIAAGESVTFGRGGLHIMAFELSDELADGGTAEVTLTFADGDKLSAPLEIKSISSTGGDMTEMDHMDHEAKY